MSEVPMCCPICNEVGCECDPTTEGSKAHAEANRPSQIFFTGEEVAEMLRSLMYKNAKSMPSRTMNKKIRTLAEKHHIKL